MRNKKMNMKKWLRFVILISLPFMLVACSSSSGFYSSDLAGNAAAGNTDISIGFLSQIFGTVGSTLQGNNNQMFGQLFYQFNLGVLMLIGVWLIYTVLTAALRGANEGSFVQGQGKNVAYNCLKIALGIAMVLPNPSSGYNLFQELMMDVTVAGVHLADNVWVATVDYLNEGHAVWVNPAGANNKVGSTLNSDTFKAFMGNNTDGSKDSDALGYNVMLAEVCMVSSGDTTLRPSIDAGTSTYIFPQGSTSSSTRSACGTVDWSTVGPLDTQGLCAGQGNPSAGNAMYCQEEQNAVASVINDLMPAALIYYCSTTADDTSGTSCSAYSSGTSDEIANDFYLADIDYTNNMYGAFDQNTSADVNSASNLKAYGSRDGWMMAGRYYWDMSNLSQTSTDMGSFKNYAVEKTGSGWATQIADMDTFNKDMGIADSTYGYLPTANNLVVEYANALDNTNANTSTGSDPDFSTGSTGDQILSVMTGGISKIFEEFVSPQSQSNPIAWITLLGQACLSVAGGVWLGTGLLVLGLGMGFNVCSSVSSIGQAFGWFLDFIRPAVLALCVMLIGVGATLGYYVPLYPYMIFTFGTIVWLIAVIEAMVAAPLIAFGLTHPEGHDFLGKAEQAMMLALGVFLRPVLMVFGLVGGMILSFVAFKIVNYTFVNFMQDLFTNSIYSATSSQDIAAVAGQAMKHAANSSTSGMVGLITFPIILVIFASIVIEVTHQCYSLIHVLPDYVLRWIGAPNANAPGESPEAMARKVGGSIDGASKAIGDANSGALSQTDPDGTKKGAMSMVELNNSNSVSN